MSDCNHDCSSCGVENCSSREIQKLKRELYTIIAEHSHTEFDKVWADSDRDYWMTAQEALDYGMIDKIFKPTNKKIADTADGE